MSSNIFGGGSFGGGNKDGASSQPGQTSGSTAPSFGFNSTANTGSAGGLFGSQAPAGGSSLFGNKTTAAPSGTSTPSFSFGQTGAAPTNPLGSSTSSGGMFANLNKAPGGNAFGGAVTTAPFGSTTPAPSKTFSFANSTTPAGPPPTDSAKASGASLFGSVQATGGQASGGGLFAAQSTGTAPSSFSFGGLGGGSAAPASSATPASSSGGLFGTSKPAQTTSAPSGGLFGGPVASSAPPTSSLFGSAATVASSTPSATPTNTLFGSKPAATTTSAPAASSLFGSAPPTNTTSAPQAGGLFGSAPPTSAPPPSSGGLFGSAPTKPAPSLFGSGASKPPTPAASTATTTPAGASLFGSTPAKTSAPSLGGMFSATSNTTTTAPTASSTPAAPSVGGLFGGGNTATTSSAPAPSSSSVAPTSSLFGAQPASGAPSAPSGTNVSGGPSNTTAAPGAGTSTLGPDPQIARLKNKTMDEIITRWASDLSKYQKEFQEQAAKVAAWDMLLVENGEKIQALYMSTLEAEKHNSEIEKQLSNVEGQQEELTAWLDRYEAEVDDMFTRQVGPGETLQGPDQEREKTYKLAEKLTERLDEMGKNLSSMIEAINDATTTLSKTSNADDPLSHIVRVLNSHLTQLQWIDQNAELLQKKIAETKKMSQSIGSNGNGGAESDVADSFYRSFASRR